MKKLLKKLYAELYIHYNNYKFELENIGLSDEEIEIKTNELVQRDMNYFSTKEKNFIINAIKVFEYENNYINEDNIKIK